MTTPEERPGARQVNELITRLRGADWDPTAERLADALWLARWIEPGDGPAAGASRGSPIAGADELPSGLPPADASAGARDTSGDSVREGDRERDRDRLRGTPVERTAPVSLYASVRHDGSPDGAFPVRAPAVGTLPGLLELQRALRPLIGYRPQLPPAQGSLDEDASADLSARSATVRPAFRAAERRGTEVQLLMDASATTSVWQLTLDSLRQTCEQLGAFRDVQVRYLHRGGDGTPLIGTGPDPEATRLRSAGQYRDTTGRRLTLVVSDCVGPLWQDGGAQRLLHRWLDGGSPLAVVQPLPPRLWPRTALPAEPGLLVRRQGTGGRVGFEADGYRPGGGPDALPVPVLLPTPAALGSWAKLLGGDGGRTVRGAAAWVRAHHHAMPAPSTAGGSRDPREVLAAFRASASPGAIQLAVHLAAVPLVLPVIQLVQEAMLPDTGPMELAEVLLSGILERLPGIEGSPGPRYAFVPGVQELLLQSLDKGAAVLVLKHLAEYFQRRFGRSARNFPALAVARLTDDADPAESFGHAPEPGQPREAATDDLFAEVPAGVVRWYIPEAAEPDRLAEAERLLRRWWAQGDPRLLHRARTLAEAVVTGAGVALDSAADDPDEGTGPNGRYPGGAQEGELRGLPRARLALGQVLHAMAETGKARREPAYARELLHLAERQLTGRALDTRFELAAVQHDLWQAEGDTAYLRAAADTLRTMVHEAAEAGRPLPDGAEGKRRLWLGRLLLSLAGTGRAERFGAAKAVRELRAAVDLLATTEEDGRQLCAALLDLSGALRRAGASSAERLANLDRAEAAAGDNDSLRLRCARARARVRRDSGDWVAADYGYAVAEEFTGRDSPERCELLAEWGEMLLEGADQATRAEGVLREALTGAPADRRLVARLHLLLGRALVGRHAAERFLPDLYEGCHELEQAGRHGPDPALRAEAWLALGRALRSFPAGHAPPARAADVLERALTEAVEARGTAPAAAGVARALHARGELRQSEDGGREAALADFRAAGAEWLRLASRFADGAEPVPWAEVQQTRERIAALEAAG